MRRVGYQGWMWESLFGSVVYSITYFLNRIPCPLIMREMLTVAHLHGFCHGVGEGFWLIVFRV